MSSEKQQYHCLHQGFDRHETMLLARVTSSRLAYLDRQKVIVPQKSGSTKKPHILYSWEQVLQLRVITDFKQKIPLALTRKIIHYFNEVGLIENWGNRHLVIVDDQIYSVAPDWSDMPEIMRSGFLANDGNEFTVIVAPNIEGIINDVWQRAIESDSIDNDSFAERAKVDPPVLLNC
jgi:DNA-binding transcriptional MerR regulator